MEEQTDAQRMLNQIRARRAPGHDAVPQTKGPKKTLDELKAAFEVRPTVEDELITIDEENRRLRAQITWQDDMIETLGFAGAMARSALYELLKPGEGIVLDVSEITEHDPEMIGDHGHVKWIYFFNRFDGGGLDLCDWAEDPKTPHGTRLSACGTPGMLKVIRG